MVNDRIGYFLVAKAGIHSESPSHFYEYIYHNNYPI
jgi:hypothetical protein